jgi:hypothetical protein
MEKETQAYEQESTLRATSQEYEEQEDAQRPVENDEDPLETEEDAYENDAEVETNLPTEEDPYTVGDAEYVPDSLEQAIEASLPDMGQSQDLPPIPDVPEPQLLEESTPPAKKAKQDKPSEFKKFDRTLPKTLTDDPGAPLIYKKLEVSAGGLQNVAGTKWCWASLTEEPPITHGCTKCGFPWRGATHEGPSEGSKGH